MSDTENGSTEAHRTADTAAAANSGVTVDAAARADARVTADAKHTPKYTPTRRCEGCGERRPKHELLRAVNNGGSLSLDPGGKSQSRGAYICRSESCLKKALKSGRMIRRLSAKSTDELRESVMRLLSEDEG